MLKPNEIAKSFVQAGMSKTSLPVTKMFVLGIFAGAFVAFAGAGSTIASCTIANPSLAKLVNALIFPAGLIMVILAGSELFTGNSLIILSVLEKKVTMKEMFKNWMVVYAGNLVGSLCIAFLIVQARIPDLFSEQLAQTMINTASAKTQIVFLQAIVKGILCNMLVCISVWVATSSKQVPGKILALYLPIAVFVLCGFEHSVANMYCIPAGIFTSLEYGMTATGLNLMGLFHNLIPVTIGNVIGGLLIGIGYHYVYLKK